jgi:hypothetical protein
MRVILSIAVGVALGFVPGCRGNSGARETHPSDATLLSAPVPASAPAGLPGMAPLAGEWIERLELDHGRIAYVTPPVGSTEKRPIVVAIHGAIDDAGLMCSAWRLITDIYPFVICPAGSKVREDTYVWPSSEAIAESIDKAVAAARARYGERIADGPAMYVAFSQGANLAGPVLGRLNRDGETGRFGRAVLTEGGYRAFETLDAARAYARAGGTRLLFTCSQPGCAGGFARSAAELEHAGVAVRVTYAGSYGHSLRPQVRESIHDALAWVVEGLPGWETYAAAPKLPTH